MCMNAMPRPSASTVDSRVGITSVVVVVVAIEGDITLTARPPMMLGRMRPRLTQVQLLHFGSALVHSPFHAAHAVGGEARFTAFGGRAERSESRVDGAFHGGGEAGWEGAYAGLDAGMGSPAGGEGDVKDRCGAGSFHRESKWRGGMT